MEHGLLLGTAEQVLRQRYLQVPDLPSLLQTVLVVASERLASLILRLNLRLFFYCVELLEFQVKGGSLLI